MLSGTNQGTQDSCQQSPPAPRANYRQHVRSGLATVLGNILNILLTLARNKLLSIFMGPAGLGLIALANNLIETAAIATGGGLMDALNRELARRKPTWTQSQLVSSALGLFALLLVLAIPIVTVIFVRTTSGLHTAVAINLIGFALACIAAGMQRLLMGVFAGLGFAGKIFHLTVASAAINLLVTAVLLVLGVRAYILFVFLTPFLLVVTALFLLRWHFLSLIEKSAFWTGPARKTLVTMGLPVLVSLILDPILLFYIRSATVARFGEIGAGLIQPGMQLMILMATLFNSFCSVTVSRWDQSGERGFSRKSLIFLAAAVMLPVLGIPLAFAMEPLWFFLVRLFFTAEFDPALPTIPWLLAGQSAVLGGTLLTNSFLSHKLGVFSVIARLCALGSVFAFIESGMNKNLVEISQALAFGYGIFFIVTALLWIHLQIRLRARFKTA